MQSAQKHHLQADSGRHQHQRKPAADHDCLQELLHLMLDLAGACLQHGCLRRPAAEAVMALCEAAALHDVRLPDGVVPALTSFVDSATDREEEQYLVQAVAHCLVAPQSCCDATAGGRQQVWHWSSMLLLYCLVLGVALLD